MTDPGGLEDHILVCTLEGFDGGIHCQVSFHLQVGSHLQVQVFQLQGSQQDFKERCTGLLKAVQDGDEPSLPIPNPQERPLSGNSWMEPFPRGGFDFQPGQAKKASGKRTVGVRTASKPFPTHTGNMSLVHPALEVVSVEAAPEGLLDYILRYADVAVTHPSGGSLRLTGCPWDVIHHLSGAVPSHLLLQAQREPEVLIRVLVDCAVHRQDHVVFVLHPALEWATSWECLVNRAYHPRVMRAIRGEKVLC